MYSVDSFIIIRIRSSVQPLTLLSSWRWTHHATAGRKSLISFCSTRPFFTVRDVGKRKCNNAIVSHNFDRTLKISRLNGRLENRFVTFGVVDKHANTIRFWTWTIYLWCEKRILTTIDNNAYCNGSSLSMSYMLDTRAVGIVNTHLMYSVSGEDLTNAITFILFDVSNLFVITTRTYCYNYCTLELFFFYN